MARYSRQNLNDVLRGSFDETAAKFDEAEAAPDRVVLPAGTYTASLESLEGRSSAKKGTPSVLATFRVTEGEHAGRLLWHDMYLTEAAIPMTKRDLGKFGITTLAQVAEPLAGRWIVSARVAERTDDDGNTRNEIRGFNPVNFEEFTTDDPAFPPQDATEPKEVF